MKTRQQLEKLRTDDERFDALYEVSYVDWDLVAEWEKETTDPKMKRIFHNASVNLYHQEEYHTFGEV